MKPVRITLRWSLALIAAWLLFCIAIGILATEMALHPGRRGLTPKMVTDAQAIAERNHAELAEVSITAVDGVTLRAWSIRPQRGKVDAVILLHGQSDNRAGMLGDAELLLRHGYAVLLPDARAHGASDGVLATYGVKETDDIRRWFDWLQRTESPHCIDGLGESMGAAELLNSLQTEPGFCAVVAESSFASFREASYDRFGKVFQARAWAGRTLLRPAVEAGLLYARLKYAVDFTQASPMNVVAASKVPVLLIHGRKDTNLPTRNSEMIQSHSAARLSAVALWEPAEAGHCGAAGAEPMEFERRVIGWFASHDTAR
ncbi:MAG: alpha/beta fold hydrolase [Terracidiphilus sp.]